MKASTRCNRRTVLAGLLATLGGSSRLLQGKVLAGKPQPGSIVKRLQGPLVPISTAFTEKEELDLKSTSQWVNWLIEQGIQLFWTTQGTSRYSFLSSAEIDDLNRSVAAVTRGRAILIAGTPFRADTNECIRFSQRAAGWGADIVMVQTPWAANPSPDQVFEHHQKIAQASPLPLFSYSLKQWPEGFLKRILELPQYVGMKNDMGNFVEHSNLLRTARLAGKEFVPMTGGWLRPFLYGHHFGARAFGALYLCGIRPKIVLDFFQHLEQQRYPEAVKIIQKYEEPMMELYGELGYHACFRASMRLRGLFGSHRDRFPMKTLDSGEVRRVGHLLESLGLL